MSTLIIINIQMYVAFFFLHNQHNSSVLNIEWFSFSSIPLEKDFHEARGIKVRQTKIIHKDLYFHRSCVYTSKAHAHTHTRKITNLHQGPLSNQLSRGAIRQCPPPLTILV